MRAYTIKNFFAWILTLMNTIRATSGGASEVQLMTALQKFMRTGGDLDPRFAAHQQKFAELHRLFQVEGMRSDAVVTAIPMFMNMSGAGNQPAGMTLSTAFTGHLFNEGGDAPWTQVGAGQGQRGVERRIGSSRTLRSLGESGLTGDQWNRQIEFVVRFIELRIEPLDIVFPNEAAVAHYGRQKFQPVVDEIMQGSLPFYLPRTRQREGSA